MGLAGMDAGKHVDKLAAGLILEYITVGPYLQGAEQMAVVVQDGRDTCEHASVARREFRDQTRSRVPGRSSATNSGASIPLMCSGGSTPDGSMTAARV